MILQSLLLIIIIIIVITNDSDAKRGRHGDDSTDINIKDYGKHYDGLVVKGNYHYQHHYHY